MLNLASNVPHIFSENIRSITIAFTSDEVKRLQERNSAPEQRNAQSVISNRF